MSQDRALLLTVAIYLLTTLVWVRNGGNWTWGRQSILGGAALLVATADRYFHFSQGAADIMRWLALEYGWYETRRWLQTAVALLIVSGIVAVGLVHLRSTRNKHSIMRVSARTICLLTLLSFCCVRALSNHYIDAWLAGTVVGLRVNWIIEWLLLGLVIFYSYRPAQHAS